MVPGMGHWGPDARPGDVSFAFKSNACVRVCSLVSLSRLQARWRRGEAVSMISAREAMLTYEQLQVRFLTKHTSFSYNSPPFNHCPLLCVQKYIPKPKI